MRGVALALVIVAAVTAVTLWRPGSGQQAPPTPASAAARSLEADSARVALTVTAPGVPAFRATGLASMTTGVTRWQIGRSQVMIQRGTTRVLAFGESVAVHAAGRTPLDDVVALLERIAARQHRGLSVEVGTDGRIVGVTAATADARISLRLGPYASKLNRQER